MENIIVFDTTLRDGEQSLKASLNKETKLQIAKALERLGVDYIEAGFPISSPGDFDSVGCIAKELKHAGVCALARAIPGDIEAAGEALQGAVRPRIHTFIATSPLHVSQKLKKEFSTVIKMAEESIRLARRYTDDIEFSCEDASRTPWENLFRIIERAIDAGATTINIPDTVGYTVPSEFGALITAIRSNVPNIDRAILSVHCHDDLGLSVANSIAAIQAGARQIEGTINGIGERAGNCALEEIAAIIGTRKDILHFTTHIKHQEIYRTSKIVRQCCNTIIQTHKAIVGENAFSHSSGIHQDGVLKEKGTYEIMRPETIGIPSGNMHMTSRSGRHIIKYRLQELGYKEDTDYKLDDIYKKFIELADKKGSVYDYDLEALLFLPPKAQDGYTLTHLSVMSGSRTIPTATVTIAKSNQDHIAAAKGNGPIEAVFKAINQITRLDLKLEDYQIHSQGMGSDALGQVAIIASVEGKKYHGISYSTDIVEASALAYLNVINTCLQAQLVSEANAMRKGSRHESSSSKVGSISI